MKRILISQRVDIIEGRNERRDALDQEWLGFLMEAGVFPVICANSIKWIQRAVRTEQIDGILLTGGNDLASCGGNASERDEVERFLIDYARQSRIPLLGVCRGMQMILDYFDGEIIKVTGHVAPEQIIDINGTEERVNSYHNWGARKVPSCFDVWGIAQDGIVKAISHRDLPITGIMWHPERIQPFRQQDVNLIKELFLGNVK